ncbi:hypothetical protein HanRHA438_Chr14g0681861 [Helianthus annuus]|nr:hypothetical protein HanIR_Chr14g0727511 [Helianthus annuus]KAJ0856213.1 hypothetical protein HanRHA438_Chr14g0681861 [Helianthus annuus]
MCLQPAISSPSQTRINLQTLIHHEHTKTHLLKTPNPPTNSSSISAILTKEQQSNPRCLYRKRNRCY